MNEYVSNPSPVPCLPLARPSLVLTHQEEEIKRQLSAAPKGTNPSPAGPGIVTSAAPAAAGVEEPPPGVAMAAGTGIATHTADGGGSGDSVVSRSISPVTDGSDGPTADSFLKRTVFPPAASEEKRNLSPARSQSKATCSAKQFSGGGAVLSGTSGTDEKGRRESDNCANHRPHRAASRSNEHRGHSRGVHDSCRPGTSPGDPDFSDQRAARTLLLSSKHVDAADYDNLRDRGDDDVAAGLLRGGLRQADEQDDHATVGDVGGDDPDNRRYSKPPLVSSSSTKSEKVGCSAKSASRKSDRISHGDRTSSSPPVGEERNVGDGAASAAATEVRAESSSPAVSRIFGMLSSLSSVGAWATRPISGRLSRASSTGSAGVRGADAGNSGGYGVGKSSRAYGGSGDGGSDQSKGAEESASYLSTAIGSKKGIDEAVGVGDAASPSKVHRQHKTARHDSDNFSSHSPRKNITGENHHPHQSVSSRSMGAGGGSAEVAGTWESDLKLALSMDLVNNGDGARGARSITRSDGIATDAMDGGSSSTGSNKRKPDASPACTPEGPSPTRGGRDYTPQHFGCAGVSTTDKGENFVREATSAAVARRLPVAAASGQGDKPREEIGSASGGTFRKGKAATTGTGLPSPGASWHTAHRRAAVEHVEAKETDDSSLVAATVQPASTTSDFAASDRWLSYRRSGSGVGAGSRRGQPHPRGDDGDCREPEGEKHGRKFDGDRTRSDVEKHITSDTVDLLANPWVKPSAIAAPHVVESSASVARTEAITSAARETESSARSESGTRHGGGKGDAHYARRRDHDVYEERTYDRVTGREFESALADTKFGSHSGNDGGGGSWRKLGGVEHGSHTIDGGYYSSTSGLKVAEAVLNDRLLGRRKGVAGAGSRDLSRGSSAQNGAVQTGSRRMVTSRYPFPHNTVAERAKNEGNESDEYHYKTLEELRRERRLRVQGLAGDASGVARGVSTALGHTSGCNGTSGGTRLDSASFERETMDRYDAYLDADDVLPDPAPSRQRHHQQQLPLQERRLRAGTAAQIVKSPRESSIATTAASTGARPPSPPRRSPDRNARAGECLLRWSNPKTARRAENIRAGASDVAGTKREPSPYRSERSALDIYRSRDYGALEAAGRRSSGYRSNSSTSVAGGTGSQDYEGARGKYRYGDIEREGGRTDALKRAESATWREDQQPGGGGGVSQKYVEMALGNSITTTATRSTYGHHRASSAAAASSNRVSLLSGGTPRRQEWKSGSLRRMLDGAGVAGKATGEHQEHHCSSPLLSGRLSSTESAAVRSASSGRSSSVSRSSVSAVPGAVARGFGGNGGTGGASTRTGLRGARAYEQQTLSSLRRSELLQHGAEGAAAGGDGFSRRRASMSSGGGAKSSFTGKFY